MTNSGGTKTGTFHGTWTADTAITVSDKRLKMNVLPLQQELLKISARRTELNSFSEEDINLGNLERTEEFLNSKRILELVNELRPVSFQYKKNSESKTSRYGFIAQEIERVLPNLVHTDEQSGLLSLHTSDLIAVLTLGIQSLDSKLVAIESNVRDLRMNVSERYLDMSDRLMAMELVLKKVLRTKITVSDDRLHSSLDQSFPSEPAPLSKVTAITRTGVETIAQKDNIVDSSKNVNEVLSPVILA